MTKKAMLTCLVKYMMQKVVDAFFNNKKEVALQFFQNIRNEHLQLSSELTDQPVNQWTQPLNDFFTEVEWLLHDKPARSYDYYYDQVVPVGELLSTSIVSHYLNKTGVKNQCRYPERSAAKCLLK